MTNDRIEWALEIIVCVLLVNLTLGVVVGLIYIGVTITPWAFIATPGVGALCSGVGLLCASRPHRGYKFT